MARLPFAASHLCLVALGFTLVGTFACSPTPEAMPSERPAENPGAQDGGVIAPPDAGTSSEPSPADAGTPEPTPADAGTAEPTRLRIAVLSDLNGPYGSTTYAASVHSAVTALTTRIKPDIVLTTGDMVAGQQAGLNYGAMWTGFHSAVTLPLSRAGIPLAPTAGNHDASGYPAYAAERTEYIRQWTAAERTPNVQFVDKSGYPFRYSFTFGGAFFLSLDATTIAPLSVEQRQWVDAQLAAASAYSVKIVFGHVPIHPVTVGRETEVTNDLELERIMRERGVTLYLTGHHHGYFPGRAGGIRQVAMACAGDGPRALIGTASPSPRALALIELDTRGESVSVEALLAPDYRETLSRQTLPAALSYGNHVLTRDDRPQ